MKGSDFSEEITKKEPSGSYSVIGGMVQNECSKINKPEGTALIRAGCALDKMLALERSGNKDPHYIIVHNSDGGKPMQSFGFMPSPGLLYRIIRIPVVLSLNGG